MKLMTKALEARFAEIGSQEDVKDPIVVAKFFNPAGAGTWYASEYLPEARNFFGYVSLFGDHCDEWGYFNLDELEAVRGQFGLGIERDLHVGEKPLSQFRMTPNSPYPPDVDIYADTLGLRTINPLKINPLKLETRTSHMKMNNNIVSLRDFAKLVGSTVSTVRYHIKKGRVKTTTREVIGISKDQIQVWKNM